uniref:Plant heme peroxidase family profile domain-containing protein n=1 Tax=Tetradesmus obliquus TaxID=3088 RepID=A0A383WLV4_TETOB|eukprot:jgi/Sobl393_1/7536/SZX78149.1
MHAAVAKCPYATAGAASPGNPHRHLSRSLLQVSAASLAKFDQSKVASLDVNAVKADLKKFMVTEQASWPADLGHYGGLMIRLAWHCAGSYRSWDGRGGCDGARQRFLPEMAWDDNTNLDKARKLLVPIKEKYGDALTWGDLIVLAGTTAIESMGAPVLGFCAGRIDDVDGTASLELGPTPEQQAVAPCTRGDGMCEQPLGQTTMGLIYVNPEGLMGNPVPKNSVAGIRSSFGRMGMNDSETVALIGGGHAFGKTHGACPTGAGPGPLKSPSNPWPGTCGSGPMKGRGPNTFTSGFEGSWTTRPTEWTNQYFRNLLGFEWVKHKGPGGHWQWKPTSRKGASGAAATADLPNIMMLTADMALLEDPEYLKYTKIFSQDLEALNTAFSHAWYKLMTRDMGPYSRCLGKAPMLPPPQPFQLQLPAPPAKLADFNAVKADVAGLLKTDTENAAKFTRLAWQCANTFRATDYAGGCNGARIRFSPQKDWPSNKGLDQVLKLLEPVKKKYPSLSWADLIVLAGTTALQQAAADAGSGSVDLKFCGGRTDAADGKGTDVLEPRSYVNASVALADNAKVMGLTPREAVALAGMLRSTAQQQSLGYSGSWASSAAGQSRQDNSYFKVLLNNIWEPSKSASGKDEFKAKGNAKLFMMPSDVAIKRSPAFAAHAGEYAKDNAKFLQALAGAWTKVMNADRFDGPAGNVCAKKA